MYYDSCTNYERIEAEKGSPLLELIEKYGSWNITNKTWTSDSWDFMTTLAQMHKYLKLSPLFTFQVQPAEGSLSFKLATFTLVNMFSCYIKMCNFIVFFSLPSRIIVEFFVHLSVQFSRLSSSEKKIDYVAIS